MPGRARERGTDRRSSPDRARTVFARRPPVAGQPRSGLDTGSMWLVTALGFIFPGLGHLYCRRWLMAAVFGIPVLAIIFASIIATPGQDPIALLLDRQLLALIVIGNGLLLLLRIGAMADLARLARDPRRTLLIVTLPVCLLAVAMHAVPAVLLGDVRATLDAITVDAPLSPASAGLLPAPDVPAARPEPKDAGGARGRPFTILLLGSDAAPDRTHRLTDTMLVVRIDPAAGRTALLSVPRDMFGVPLPDGTSYDAKLNSLMSYADASPGRFAAGGAAVLKATIGRLLGHEIDYYAAVDMPGFARVVDAAGGVDVNVTREIADPPFYVSRGRHHFDGRTALSFVSSRMSPGDSDFVRAERQQDVMLSLYTKLARPEAISSWPSVSAAVRTSVVTDIPADQLPRLAATFRSAQASTVERVVLQPPEYATAATGSGGAYILIPHLDAIRAAGGRLMFP